MRLLAAGECLEDVVALCCGWNADLDSGEVRHAGAHGGGESAERVRYSVNELSWVHGDGHEPGREIEDASNFDSLQRSWQ